MVNENELMYKCLEITRHILDDNQKVFINVKIGETFAFTFNNQEKKVQNNIIKKSPSSKKRDLERKEVFKVKHEKFKQTEDATDSTEHSEEKFDEKADTNLNEKEEEVVENELNEETEEETVQHWKIKVFSDDLDKLENHILVEKN